MSVDFRRFKYSDIFFKYKQKTLWDMSMFENAHPRKRRGFLRNFWNFYTDVGRLGFRPILNISDAVNFRDRLLHLQNFMLTKMFPLDYWDRIERAKGRRLQKQLGKKVWGLEVGIRFFPTKEHFPIVPVEDFDFLISRLSNLAKMKSRDASKLYVLTLMQKVELVLMGGPDVMQKSLGWMYKFWIFQTMPEMELLARKHVAFPTKQALQAFWDSSERRGLEKILQRWLLQDVGLSRRVKRAYRWHLLSYVRSVREEYYFSRFGPVSFILRFCIDFWLGRYRVKK